MNSLDFQTQLKFLNDYNLVPYIKLNNDVVYNISPKAIRNLKLNDNNFSFLSTEKGEIVYNNIALDTVQSIYGVKEEDL